MDVIEHERLSNITLRHKIKLKNSTFIAVLHFSHSKVFNNEQNSYPKMCVKQTLSCNWMVLFTSANIRCIWGSLSFVVLCGCICCYFFVGFCCCFLWVFVIGFCCFVWVLLFFCVGIYCFVLVFNVCVGIYCSMWVFVCVLCWCSMFVWVFIVLCFVLVFNVCVGIYCFLFCVGVQCLCGYLLFYVLC